MPIMDGLKLIKRIRSDAIHHEVPIMIITTEGAQEDRQKALQLGADCYITKPIQHEALTNAKATRGVIVRGFEAVAALADRLLKPRLPVGHWTNCSHHSIKVRMPHS